MQCERCSAECVLCPGYYPWTVQHYICQVCDSTYIYESDPETGEIGELLIKNPE